METILLLMIFILIPLANYVLERMRRRYQPPPSSSGRIPDMGMRRQAAPPPPPVAGRERAPDAAATKVQRSRRHRPGHRLFRNKRDVRRVIIAMTILGPCRAYDRED